MKKIILLAALVVASTTIYAAGDKKKKKETAPVVQKVELISPSDSLSYAAGKSLTRGLMEYLTKECKLDTAYMTDFVAGFREAMAKSDDHAYNAHIIGQQIAQMVDQRMAPGLVTRFEGTEHIIDMNKLHEGFLSELTGDTTLMSLDTAVDYFTNTGRAAEEKKNEAWKAQNTQWLKDNATKEGVKTTASGLQYKVITEGTGTVPTKDCTVTVKYEGKTIEGKVFDSSYTRNPQTTDFRPNQVIKGWTEALCMMPEGSKWELYIPQELAYGSRQMGQEIKPYSTLIFTVELVKVKQPEPAAKPAETKTDAKATSSAKTGTKTAAKSTKTTAAKKGKK